VRLLRGGRDREPLLGQRAGTVKQPRRTTAMVVKSSGEVGVRDRALAKRASKQTIGSDVVWPAGAAVPGQVAPTKATMTSRGGGGRCRGTGRDTPG
jgi:hypothetical protein